MEYHRDLVYRIGRQCLDFCAGDPKDALRHGQCCAVQCCTVHTVVFLFDAISVFYAYPQLSLIHISMTVDGKPVSGNILSPVPAGSTVEVKIVMG